MILSSAGFTDLHNTAAQLYRSLVFSMDDIAGMAGDDDAGKKFAAKYDPAAQKIVDAMAQVVGQLGGTANGLYTMAINYLQTEADVATSLMAPQKLPESANPECDEEVAKAALRSAVGHNDSGAIHDLLKKFWPQGDPGKLRQAATGWKNFAGLVSRLGVEGDKRVQRVTASSSSSAVTSFAQNWALMHDGCATQGPLLNSITNAAFKLGQACEAYAREVEDLRDKLEDLAVGAGIVAGVGIALTFFTFGGSDVAAAGGEAAIAAEAGTAAVAMAAAVEGSAELAVLAEAAAVVDSAAASLIPVGAGIAATATAAVVLAGAGDAAAAPGPKPPPFTVTPGMQPLPHDPLSPFPLLPAQQQAAIRAWMTQMEQDGRTYQANGPHAPAPPAKADPKINARRAYQVRVAGSTEYRLYTDVTDPATGRELGMDADGVRPEDGAAIDAKYIGTQQSCRSPFRLDNADNVFEFAYENTMEGESKKLEKYASALKDPRNKVTHLELITNDPKASTYFQSLMTAQGVTGRVRIEP
ncbi:restriction endonuclease fold toxin-2 domain-containing protein [Kitasatospora brasiliensis]|uniref:restriction endonuclease fold toxin-2 domain-containing protein n=1 Tax=Kitasatospora brasiliensis TaxID=3058040 RepID=UPI00292F9759|nr:restriction endonuclease fold toxin-2 domain-containing protein [Kitasatospora sp. K002]